MFVEVDQRQIQGFHCSGAAQKHLLVLLKLSMLMGSGLVGQKKVDRRLTGQTWEGIDQKLE